MDSRTFSTKLSLDNDSACRLVRFALLGFRSVSVFFFCSDAYMSLAVPSQESRLFERRKFFDCGFGCVCPFLAGDDAQARRRFPAARSLPKRCWRVLFLECALPFFFFFFTPSCLPSFEPSAPFCFCCLHAVVATNGCRFIEEPRMDKNRASHDPTGLLEDRCLSNSQHFFIYVVFWGPRPFWRLKSTIEERGRGTWQPYKLRAVP